MNPTETGLLARGIDRHTAIRLREDGWTLSGLQSASQASIKKAKLTDTQVAQLRAKGRPPIPAATLISVLFANRFTCCVCRDGNAAIVVHHIVPWAKSHSHARKNLAVVCLSCHGKAHTTGELVVNLNAKRLRELKAAWEAAVEQLDPKSILDAARINYAAWNYFNHLRLTELAKTVGIDLKRLPSFARALACNVVDLRGAVTRSSRIPSYLYEGPHGMERYAYVKEMMDEVLRHIKVTNISDHLDRGTLPSILAAGDFIYVQGAHTFVEIEGPGESCRGSRKANGIEIKYVFDRKEATSNSALSMWLRGRKDAGSLVQLRTIERKAGRLIMQGTIFGICAAMDGLKRRMYELSLLKSGLPRVDEFEFEKII